VTLYLSMGADSSRLWDLPHINDGPRPRAIFSTFPSGIAVTVAASADELSECQAVVRKSAHPPVLRSAMCHDQCSLALAWEQCLIGTVNPQHLCPPKSRLLLAL
jgi:hypothetical protein